MADLRARPRLERSLKPWASVSRRPVTWWIGWCRLDSRNAWSSPLTAAIPWLASRHQAKRWFDACARAAWTVCIACLPSSTRGISPRCDRAWRPSCVPCTQPPLRIEKNALLMTGAHPDSWGEESRISFSSVL